MCGGGGGAPPPPAPSAAEVQLQLSMLDMLSQGRSELSSLRPYVLSEAGFSQAGPDPETRRGWEKQLKDTQATLAIPGIENDSQYQYLKSTESSLLGLLSQASSLEKTHERLEKEARASALQTQIDEATGKQLQLYGLQAERQERALRGELPVSEGTAQRKAQEFNILKENLARGGNPIIGDDPATAYSLTTAGGQSLEQFNKRYGLLEDAERRGEISEGQAGLLGSLGLTSGIGYQGRGELLQTGAAGLGSSSLVGGPLNMSQYYGQAQQPYQFQRSLQYEAANQAAANKAAQGAGWMQLGGQVGSAALLAAAISAREFKKDIREATPEEEDRSLKAMRSPKVYRYNYKDEPDGEPRRIGFMAGEAPKEILHDSDKRFLHIPKTMGLMTAAIRSLARKVDKLEEDAA